MDAGNGERPAIDAGPSGTIECATVTDVREVEAVEMENRLEAAGAVGLLQLPDCRHAVDMLGAITLRAGGGGLLRASRCPAQEQKDRRKCQTLRNQGGVDL